MAGAGIAAELAKTYLMYFQFLPEQVWALAASKERTAAKATSCSLRGAIAGANGRVRRR